MIYFRCTKIMPKRVPVWLKELMYLLYVPVARPIPMHHICPEGRPFVNFDEKARSSKPYTTKNRERERVACLTHPLIPLASSKMAKGREVLSKFVAPPPRSCSKAPFQNAPRCLFFLVSKQAHLM
jgi:hypothetical protein